MIWFWILLLIGRQSAGSVFELSAVMQDQRKCNLLSTLWRKHFPGTNVVDLLAVVLQLGSLRNHDGDVEDNVDQNQRLSEQLMDE